MFDRHEMKPLKPSDSVHESTREASECKSIIDWSHNVSEEDVHHSLALTEEDCAFEEQMSELADFKAPDGSGRRILKAVFAQTGIEREPLVHMSKIKMFRKLLSGGMILSCTIMAFVLIITVLWNWKYLGDPESLVQSRDQIASRFKEVGTINSYSNLFTGKTFASKIHSTTKTYIAALMLMDFPVNKYKIRFNIRYLTTNIPKNGEKGLSSEMENYSNALEAYKKQPEVLALIDKANKRDWSFDEVQPEVCNFIETGRPWGDEYFISQQKLGILTSIHGILTKYYFYKNEADKAVKHLISGLRLAEFMRTSGSVLSLNRSTLNTFQLLMVLDNNIEKVRTAEKSTREHLKVVLKGQNLMSAIRRSAAATSYFEAGSLIQLFGILRSNSKLSLIGAKDSWTLTFIDNNMLKWMGRPLLVNDAGNYLIYKSQVLETIWHITNDDTLLEERISTGNDQTFEKSEELRTWRGSWPEILDNLNNYSTRYSTNVYQETDYLKIIKDCLPIHRAAQKTLTKVEKMDY